MRVNIPLIGGMEVPKVTPPETLGEERIVPPTLDDPRTTYIICELCKKVKGSLKGGSPILIIKRFKGSIKGGLK
jgi:hypothetical protein